MEKMEEAYCNLDNELSVSIAIKIAPNKKAGTDLTTKLSFTAEKVTEKYEATVDENQMDLPLTTEKALDAFEDELHKEFDDDPDVEINRR